MYRFLLFLLLQQPDQVNSTRYPTRRWLLLCNSSNTTRTGGQSLPIHWTQHVMSSSITYRRVGAKPSVVLIPFGCCNPIACDRPRVAFLWICVVVQRCKVSFFLVKSRVIYFWMQHLREDQSLLVWRNPLLILDFLLYVFNGIRRFDIEGNRFTCKSLDENLHGGWINVKW